MKKMMRLLSMILACVLILPTCSFSVMANETNILFSADFSSVTVGEKPTIGTGNDQWTGILENETKKLFVRGAMDGTNKVLKIGCEEDGTKGGPRITRNVSLQDCTDVKIKFRVKTAGTKLSILLTSDSDGSTSLWSGQTTDWATVLVKLDLENNVFTTMIDGVLVDETKALHTISNYTTTTLRFTATPQPGQSVYIDDILVAEYDPALPDGISVPSDATVFMEADFENITGSTLMSKTGIFNAVTSYTDVYNDSGNMVMRYYAGDGQEHYPRVTYDVEYEVNTVCVDYAVKPSISEVTLELYSDGALNKGGIALVKHTVSGVNANEWNYVHAEFNLETCKVNGTINGRPFTEVTLNPVTDLSTLKVRLNSHLAIDDAMYYDNIVIYTLDELVFEGPLRPNNQVDWSCVQPSLPLSQNSYVNNLNEEHPRILVRSWDAIRAKLNTTKLFTADFSSVAVGATPAKGTGNDQWTGILENETKKLFVRGALDDDGINKVLKICCEEGGTAGGPRITRSISLEGQKNVRVSFRVKAPDTRLNVSLTSDSGGSTSLWSAKTSDWSTVQVGLDLENNVYTKTLNGVLVGSGALHTISDYTTTTLRFTATPQPGQSVYIDDIAVEVYDPTAHTLYNNIKLVADACLTTNAPAYAQGATGNVLGKAREGKNRLICLAFAYNIEQDSRYLEDAYEEMIQMGAWQDWSAQSAYLATGELMFGYACAVDWLYDDLTQTERDAIYNILKSKALTMLVYNYEKPDKSDFHNAYNWNPVCNAGAIGVALAYADEHPEVCEYIIENALEFLTLAAEGYTADGGYEEGNMYWSLGAIHFAFNMDMIENAFVDSFELPSDYIFSNTPGFSKTGDFMIYHNGGAGRFNYGDATVGFNKSGVMYWLANRYNKPEYTAYMTNLQNQTGWISGGYSAALALISYNPAHAAATLDSMPLDRFFIEEAQGYNGISLRSSWTNDETLYASMQGGYNGLTHLYLSLGTYVVDYNGKRFIKQLGEHNYNLSGTKESIYYKRAEGSNTLVMNPSTEADQQTTTVHLEQSGTSAGTAFGILNMAPTNENYVSAKRGMMITDNRSRIIVQDEVVAQNPSEFYWFANTDATITLAEDKQSATLEMDGEQLLVRIVRAPQGAEFEIMDRVSVVEGVQNTVSDGSKLAIHMENIQNLELCVEYVGLTDDEENPTVWTYVPMAQWTAVDASSPESGSGE